MHIEISAEIQQTYTPGFPWRIALSRHLSLAVETVRVIRPIDFLSPLSSLIRNPSQ